MRVDNLAKLVADKDLVPGKPGESPIVKRMSLPVNDSDRMPPPEKPPVDAWETAAVWRGWRAAVPPTRSWRRAISPPAS